MFDVDDLEQAGIEKPLVANNFLFQRMSTMKGNGTATGSETSNMSTPSTGEAIV